MAGHPSRRRLLVVATDLIWQSRLIEAARALAFEPAVAATAEAARDALRSTPDLLVLDLQAALDWRDVVEAANAARVPVLAYGQHTKGGVLRAARRASAAGGPASGGGCDIVVPRSTLVADLPSLIQRAMAARAGSPR
ncbi:MAG TPA: hypothetical protein VFT91_02295 [Dehalococcoidia bacterium]|nr:hypothetical protein [Dehalococcoidia bacterium]